MNIGYINLPILIPDQDAISEFKVQYNNLGPEWGKFSGGIINLSTKGGANAFHGEAYEYLRNKVLNSRPYFVERRILLMCRISSAARLAARLSKIRRFSSSPMTATVSERPLVFTTTVPTVGERSGVFPSDVPIYDPLSISAGVCRQTPRLANCGRTQFANNTIPTSRLTRRLG